MNKENFGFYKNIGVENLQDLSVQGGFDTWADMLIVYPYFKKSSSVLELGAGYGRCIEFLVKEKYQGKIFAIEQSEVFVAYLKERYQEQVIIYGDDFNEVELPQKIDCVLWMWSGILDFTPEEQQDMFQKIFDIMTPKGILIVDTPRIGFTTFAQHQDAQHLHHESSYGNLDCYIPSLEDIQSMAKKSNYPSVEQIDYNTTTDKQRTVFVIKKSI